MIHIVKNGENMHNEQKISVNEPEFMDGIPKPYALLSKLNANDLELLHATIQRYHKLYQICDFIESLDSHDLTADESEYLEATFEFFIGRANECYHYLGFPLYCFGRSD